jgi:hypothetical protein
MERHRSQEGIRFRYLVDEAVPPIRSSPWQENFLGPYPWSLISHSHSVRLMSTGAAIKLLRVGSEVSEE